MTDVLVRLANDFAEAVPEVDATAAHERWQPGLGPFEEQNQIRLLLDHLRELDDFYRGVNTSVRYPTSNRQCDIVVDTGGSTVPIEAKLLRFRRDNGKEDPNRYTTVFSPFNSNNPTTLMNDAYRLHTSKFEAKGGLVGIYYERENEPFDRMNPSAIAEKFARDVNYWYDFGAETKRIAEFVGLRHPVFQQGAVITWEIVDRPE